MSCKSFPDGGRDLPRIAYGDPAMAARMLTGLIPDIIAKAEAMGAAEVAGHLRMALAIVERRVADGQLEGPSDTGLRSQKGDTGEAK